MSTDKILENAGLKPGTTSTRITQMAKAFSNIPANDLFDSAPGPAANGAIAARISSKGSPQPFVVANTYRNNGTVNYFVATSLAVEPAVRHACRKDKDLARGTVSMLNDAYAFGRLTERQASAGRIEALDAQIAELQRQLTIATNHAVTMD